MQEYNSFTVFFPTLSVDGNRNYFGDKHLQMLMNVRSLLVYVVEEVSVRTPLAPTPAHRCLLLTAPLGLLLT